VQSFVRSLAIGIFASGLANAVVAQSPKKSCLLNSQTVVSVQRYEFGGFTWEIAALPPKTSQECLLSYVTELHKNRPDIRFEFFDANAPALSAYARWAANGMNDGERYPEKWVQKHQIATLQPLSDGIPCGLWQLLDRDHKSLAKFDRIKCRGN
jgi:hypothetical protein